MVKLLAKPLKVIDRLKLALQAAGELGPGQVGQFAVYQLQLRSGWLRQQTAPRPWPQIAGGMTNPLPGLPSADELRA